MKREAKRQLRARRAALREKIRAQRAALRRARRPRKRRRWVLLALLLLLLLLRECNCDPAPTPVGPGTPPPPVPPIVTEPPPPSPPAPKPVKAKIRRRRRPAMTTPAPPRKLWLDDFRLQVAARSLRLSNCFQGADRPGAVRWSCALDPRSGEVSDQRFEPIGRTPIDAAQRRCLKKALAEPAYRLDPGEDAPTPDRVSLVLEF